MREYDPPEQAAARRRARGRRLTLGGAVLAATGLFGLLFTQVLDLVWLDPVAEATGPLALISLALGVAAFGWGFQLIRSARRTG